MPYVVRERLKTAGKHMYLIRTPLSDNSVGLWTEHREDAKKFKTLEKANTASGKLSVLSAGIPEHYIPQMEDSVFDSDWVIKSNITNEYIVQAQIYREPETWSHKLSKALRFETAGAAKAFASDHLLGGPVKPDDAGQTLDMEYIAVPRKREKSDKNPLFQNTDTAESDYHFVIGCNATMQYLRKFFWANKTVEWVRDIRKAKQFKFRASAETSGERVSTAAASTSIYVVDSKTHKIVQRRYCGPEQNLEEKMPEKRSFRIQMKHEVGYQIDVTYEATTEMEALDQMFEEVKKMPNKPFTAGSIKMHEGTVCDTDDAGKSM